MHHPHPSTRVFTDSHRTMWQRVLVAPLLVMTMACHDLAGLAGTQQLPAGTSNPNVYHTTAGALALYQAALAAFQYSYGVATTSIGGGQTDTTAGAFVDFVLMSGLLADELKAGDLGCADITCSPSAFDLFDARQLPERTLVVSDHLYAELQQVRNDASVGIGALELYDSTASPALQGRLYALAGYSELFLADLFCSGIPLSTIPAQGNFTYAAGSTTTQVYQDALAKFNVALTLSGDSAEVEDLAWVGKSRALLALDSLPQAGQAAAHVPNGFSYQFLVDWTGKYGNSGGNLFTQNSGYVTVADQKGGNGLPYLSSNDPRTASQALSTTNLYGASQEVPVKYGGATPGILPITVADWIEARLIQAEAALHGAATGQGTWLDQLNTLRQTAITPALPVLSDPGDSPGDTARVNLLFRERAYWLFLTGHRQGDLRRLIRQYGRQPDEVYPSGSYPQLKIGVYGLDLTAPIPSEELANPLFHGCFSRGAQ